MRRKKSERKRLLWIGGLNGRRCCLFLSRCPMILRRPRWRIWPIGLRRVISDRVRVERRGISTGAVEECGLAVRRRGPGDCDLAVVSTSEWACGQEVQKR